MLTDKQRAGLIALIQSLFPVAVLLGLNVDSQAQAAIMLAITNGITFCALIFPAKAVASEPP